MVTGADVVLLPAVSVATTVIVCLPLGSDPVTHHSVPEHVVAFPQLICANWVPLPKNLSVASPTLSVAVAVTSMLLPVQSLFGGLVSAGLGGGVVVPLHAGAPDAFTGLVASLLIATFADTVQLPAVSVATAWISYLPAGSEPVAHQAFPEQVVPLHGSVAKTAPLP